MPMVHMEYELSNGITPFAIIVLITGIFSLVANSVSSFAAWPRTTPLPARITGFFAWKIMPAASCTVSSSAYSFGAIFFRSGFSPSETGIFATFTGISMCVAPGFSLSAYLNARRTISPTVSGRTTILVRFVIGSNILVRSRN